MQYRRCKYLYNLFFCTTYSRELIGGYCRCKNNFIEYEGDCISTCPSGYGKMIENGKYYCTNCDGPCSSCENSTDFCKSCNDPYF